MSVLNTLALLNQCMIFIARRANYNYLAMSKYHLNFWSKWKKIPNGYL